MGRLFSLRARSEKAEFTLTAGRIASIIEQAKADDAPLPEEYMLRGKGREGAPEPRRLGLQPGA
jgi:hypothetical protein